MTLTNWVLQCKKRNLTLYAALAQNELCEYKIKSHVHYLKSTYAVRIKYMVYWRMMLGRTITLKFAWSKNVFITTELNVTDARCVPRGREE